MANSNNKGGQATATEPQNKPQAFFTKNSKAILGGVAAVVVIVIAVILLHSYYFLPREDKASTALAKGQDYFSQEQFDKALNGDGAGYAGFANIASDYSGTEAGNLAKLYAGLCYANLDKWQQAVDCLEDFDGKGDQMISPAAEAALGNAYAHLKQYDKAVEKLKDAAAKADNNSLSPTFLIQAGEILESQGKADEALKLYQEVKQKYQNSMAYQTIDKYIERATTK